MQGYRSLEIWPSCQVLPEAQSAESGAVVLEEPGPGKVTHLAEDITPLLLYKGKDWSLFCRAEEKSKEFFSFSICIFLDNQVKVFLRLPREATSRRLLPREPNHTYVSRGIQTIQSFLKLNHATSYISRDSRIRPSVSRGIKTIPSQRLPRNQNHTISTSPEGTKPYHLNFSRV